MTFAAAKNLFKPAAALAAVGSVGLAGCGTTSNFSTLAPNSPILHPSGGLEQICADLNGGARIVYNAPLMHKLYLAQVFGDVNAYSTADRNVAVTARMPGYLIMLHFTQARGELIPHATDRRPQAEWNGRSPVPLYETSKEEAREVAQTAISDIGAVPRRLAGACPDGLLSEFNFQ